MEDDFAKRIEIVLPTESVLLPVPGNIASENGFLMVSCGDNIYWQSFLQADQESPSKGTIFYFHGYADHTSWYIRDHILRFAIEGFNVHCADYPGHGRSSGLHGYIPSFQSIAISMGEFIKIKRMEIMKTNSNSIQKYFFVSESMGSAVASHCWEHFRYDPNVIDKTSFHGIVMIAPLCGMKDPGIVSRGVLKSIAYLFPRKCFIPQASLNDKSVKNVTVRENALLNTLYYRAPIRNKSALEILNAADKMMTEIAKTSVFPLLIVHGSDDIVTSPELSKSFYDISPSVNKQYISYKGVWHAMLSGEDIETISKIYSDILKWMDNVNINTSTSLTPRKAETAISSATAPAVTTAVGSSYKPKPRKPTTVVVEVDADEEDIDDDSIEIGIPGAPAADTTDIEKPDQEAYVSSTIIPSL